MPRIFDNIALDLLPALKDTLHVSQRADFCVGYFNLRGWKNLDCHIEQWEGGPDNSCRLLVGMQKAPKDELRDALRLAPDPSGVDNQAAVRAKRELALEFRDQLTLGMPTDEDEKGLRRLARQIRAQKVVVKLYLRNSLHAKLYLMHRKDLNNPITGFVGSSNLTFAGLKGQGELNVDVLDLDAATKLAKWFEDRWNDRWCIDISDDLANVIEESWAREDLIPPYHIYLKMAYHLSQEARAGVAEFQLPKIFRDTLFDYQIAAVKIAARHLHKRGGVLIGDVVGLGKTLMATALARMFEDDFGLETLILSPKNLVPMWEFYRSEYGLRGRVMPITRAMRELPDLKRYRLVLIDESHNLRNREGKVYKAIRDYIEKNESRCILLTATPYNKTYLDLSNQLRLFVPETKDIGIRPEQLLKRIGIETFNRLHQCSPRSLAAFEKSDQTDDWRELMRLFMVRRTRSFIQTNYARTDATNGRKYLTFPNGKRSYFPARRPATLKFGADPQFDVLYSDEVVSIINGLMLPRYGLGNYENSDPQNPPTSAEAKLLKDLGRAGKRLMGFCRTNLFKRLESSGRAFVLSVERHILRNYLFLHAIENGLPLPIGTQDAELLDGDVTDEEETGEIEEEFPNPPAPFPVSLVPRWEGGVLDPFAGSGGLGDPFPQPKTQAVDFSHPPTPSLASERGGAAGRSEMDFHRRAAAIYAEYETKHKRRFKWIPARLFRKSLHTDLLRDARALQLVLDTCATWEAGKDGKLNRLLELLETQRPDDKVLIFTQFADTARYLEAQLRERGVERLGCATGGSSDPTSLVWRFSPESSGHRKMIAPGDELRVLIATDVLSEGQNLQDCAIIVNYDLPWAIIRLIQRAGRVDRIGQQAEEILCCSFLPAEGVDKIIHLRERVKQRLKENAEVVGTDEAFFEDEQQAKLLVDLYNERSTVLEGDNDTEVDLASYAYQIYQNALADYPAAAKAVEAMPNVVYSTKKHLTAPAAPTGALVYMRTAEGNDALAWIDEYGKSVTESQYTILRAAECSPSTPALPRGPLHHALVQAGVEHVLREEKSIGGQLGRPSGARFKTYERLKRYANEMAGTLFATEELERAVDEIYRYPLTQTAADMLNYQIRNDVSDEMLASLAVYLRGENRLCLVTDEPQSQEPRILCSLGLLEA